MELQDLRTLIDKKQKIDLSKLTEYEKRCYWQILDEETRLGEFRRVKYENMMDEFVNPTYLTQLVYYLKNLKVVGKDF